MAMFASTVYIFNEYRISSNKRPQRLFNFEAYRRAAYFIVRGIIHHLKFQNSVICSFQI